MKDPRRLLDGDGNEEQRALLRAAALEEPTADGRARLLGALGVTAASIGAPPPTAQAPSTATGGLTAGSSAASATKLVLLALGSAALLGTGALLWPRGETPAGRAASSPSSAGAGTSLPRHDQAAHNAAPKGSVALEIDAIERVRSELARKDGKAALSALRRYASEHPAGVLAHEADVLRVEALLQDGEALAALQLAQQLLREHGDSPHRARLEALARQASAPAAP